jgi:hypothetical protein
MPPDWRGRSPTLAQPASRPAQRSTRMARSVFHRLGSPSSSIWKWTSPRWFRSSRQRPSSTPLRDHQVDGLVGALIRFGSGVPQVVQRSQHVVPPACGEREQGPVLVDDLTGGEPAHQPAIEEVLLSAPAGCGDLRRGAVSPLVLEEPFDDIDRRVERAPRRPVLLLAVPAPVVHLLGEEAIDDPSDVLAEVGADPDRPAIDAGLDLAVEEALPVVIPAAVLPYQLDGLPGSRIGRVETEVLEHDQGEQGRGPRLPGSLRPPLGPEGCTGPLSVGVTQGQQPGSPAFLGDSLPVAATVSSGSSSRSRRTCHRMPGSASRSQSMTSKVSPPSSCGECASEMRTAPVR